MRKAGTQVLPAGPVGSILGKAKCCEVAMIIECPSCRFRRDVPSSSVRPGKKYKVTCPRCSFVFHFSLPEQETPSAEEDAFSSAARQAEPVAAQEPVRPEAEEKPSVPHLSTEQEGDDPLPPGAQIPQFSREEPAAEKKEEKPEEKREEPQRPLSIWERWQSMREHVRQYDEEQEEPASRNDGRPDGAPWESPEYYGFWGSFSRTLLGVLFHAPDFFRHVRCNFSVIRPILFYVLLSLFQMLASRLWSMKALRELTATATDPQVLAMAETLMQSMNLPLMLLVTPFFSIFQAVILAGLYHLMIRRVQPDRADFATTLRVVCYSAAPLVLCIVPMVGSLIASIWFVSAAFIGCKFALNLSWVRTVLALLPLYILEFALVSQIPAFMAGM